MVLSKFECVLIENKKVTNFVNKLKFSKPESFEFQPGQYINIGMLINNKRVRRAYSITSIPSESFLEIYVKNVGECSNFLCNSKKGDKFEVIGPMGSFVIKNKENNICLVSSGTGIAPFISMVNYLIKTKFNKKILIFAGFRSEKDLIYEKEFSSLKKKYPKLSFKYILSQPKNKLYPQGYVQDLLDNSLVSKKFDFYICGLSKMVSDTSSKLIKLKIPKKQINFERYN